MTTTTATTTGTSTAATTTGASTAATTRDNADAAATTGAPTAAATKAAATAATAATTRDAATAPTTRDASTAPTTTGDDIHERVRERYAESARQVLEQGAAACCAEPGIGPELYSALERDELPGAAVLASLGCGNPTAVADLREGERVLDLGSGGGIDVLLSARRVGPAGRAIGLDMTDEMLDLAQRNAAEAGISNVEFLKGTIEAIPLPAGSIDVVISNCVVNLAADKPAVFAEIARVLRPGGRIGITDIVADDGLTPAERAERGCWVGCIAGALSFSEFDDGLRAVGLTDVTLTRTHEVTPGMHSVIVQARKPEQAPVAVTMRAIERPEATGSAVPMLEAADCCGGQCC